MKRMEFFFKGFQWLKTIWVKRLTYILFSITFSLGLLNRYAPRAPQPQEEIIRFKSTDSNVEFRVAPQFKDFSTDIEAYLNAGECQKAYPIIQVAIDFSQKRGMKDAEAYSWTCMGKYHQNCGSCISALNCYQKAYELKECPQLLKNLSDYLLFLYRSTKDEKYLNQYERYVNKIYNLHSSIDKSNYFLYDFNYPIESSEWGSHEESMKGICSDNNKWYFPSSNLKWETQKKYSQASPRIISKTDCSNFISQMSWGYKNELIKLTKSDEEVTYTYDDLGRRRVELDNRTLIDLMPKEKKRKYILLTVGINDYEDNAFQTLRFAEKDARDITNALRNTRGINLEAYQLIGKDATRNNIVKILHRLTEQSGSNDQIIIYYSGHGSSINSEYQIKKSYLRCIIPFDAELNNLKKTALSYGDIDRILTLSKLKKAPIVLIDACGNDMGKAIPTFGQTECYSKENTPIFISSSTLKGKSGEIATLKNSIFTFFLVGSINNIQTLDLNDNQEISLTEFYFGIKEKTDYFCTKMNLDQKVSVFRY